MALGTDFAMEFENYKRRCLELEEKRKFDEAARLMLEIDLKNFKKKNRELEEKITSIQKVVNNEENVKQISVDLVDKECEEDKLLQLMIEIQVLECEKQKAETELCSWKKKVKELESRVSELESNIKAMNEKDTNDISMVSRGTKEESCSKVRKRLPFEEYECLNKNMMPSTPGVARSPFHGVIDISDEDVCYKEIPKVEKFSDSTKCDSLARNRCSSNDNLEKTNLEHLVEEHTDDFNVHSLRTRSAKRKRVANVITSDDETSDDDNVLICTFMTQNSCRLITASEDEVKEEASKGRLTRLRKLESKSRQNKSGFDLNETICLHGNSSSEDEEDINCDEEGLESEGDSLDEFIVDSSESASESASRSVDSCGESEDVLDEYKATLDKIGRKKISNRKWDLEGDMLADFGKDPELCMRAVCALYRQQTKDEKAYKEAIHHNGRGFSQTDALKGSKLAEFLTDGNSGGDLNKTVEELEHYDSKGIKTCRTLATKYSKQLFKSYQNNEDLYFLPK